MIGADALIFHLNASAGSGSAGRQSQLQRTDVRKIAAVCRELAVPVVAKEVGNGISVDAARSDWQRAGVKAHRRRRRRRDFWSAVEAQRAVKQGNELIRPLPTGAFRPRKRSSACARRCRIFR